MMAKCRIDSARSIATRPVSPARQSITFSAGDKLSRDEFESAPGCCNPVSPTPLERAGDLTGISRHMGQNHDDNNELNETPGEFESHDEQEANGNAPGETEVESADEFSLHEEIGLLKDALLRTRAEMDNFQKRADREIDKSRKFAVEGLLRDLVPVIDSLDQGIDSATQSENGTSEGMSLTRKLLVDTLSRHGLSMLDPAGERFDPQWHEAMSLQPSAEHEPDTVIAVLQRGYRLHDRLVRPARVIVSREP